jgi:hypothetical protein
MAVPAPQPRPVSEPPPGLADALAGVVAAAMPAVAARVPDDPAAAVGRLAAPALGSRIPHGVDVFLAERLLGALELTVRDLVVDVPALAAHVPPRRDGPMAVGSMTGGGETAAAVQVLDQVAPGVRGLVDGLVGALAEHPGVAPLLTTGSGTEPEVAAAHGRAHLALAVVTARAVLLAARVPVVGADAPVVVGVALGAVERVLRERPMPPAYAAALLERRRAEYLLPRATGGQVPVAGHRFALAEGAFPDVAGEPANGMVQVVPGGLVVRTGAADGGVSVIVRVLAEEPEPDLVGWDEVVDVSYVAEQGAASLVGPHAPALPHLQGCTPPWPGRCGRG